MNTKSSEESSKQQVSSADLALAQLLERSLNGDESAYRSFLEQTSRILKRFLRQSSYGRNCEQQIDEVVQEVLLTIHKKRDLYRRGMPVLPWVRAIAKYRLIDSLRAEARTPETIALAQDFEGDFAQSSQFNEFDLEDSMACLNHRQREVLILAKVQELSHSEIASRFGMSLSAVKISVHRSLILLRKKMHAKN